MCAKQCRESGAAAPGAAGSGRASGQRQGGAVACAHTSFRHITELERIQHELGVRRAAAHVGGAPPLRRPHHRIVGRCGASASGTGHPQRSGLRPKVGVCEFGAGRFAAGHCARHLLPALGQTHVQRSGGAAHRRVFGARLLRLWLCSHQHHTTAHHTTAQHVTGQGRKSEDGGRGRVRSRRRGGVWVRVVPKYSASPAPNCWCSIWKLKRSPPLRADTAPAPGPPALTPLTPNVAPPAPLPSPLSFSFA
jgi:hypothetical protein